MDESKSASRNVGTAIAQCHSREAFWIQYVHRAAEGDDQALASLYDETSPLVYSLALRMLGDTADAEEVTFDVYTQVWRSAKSFDAQRGTITAWLVTLTRSRAIDRLRSVAVRSQHEEHLPEFPQMAASPENPEQSQQRRLVRAALEVLPPEQRQAIEMAFFSGLSHSEVATKLGLPLGTAKTRIRLGMMKLRELLGAGA